MIFLANGWGKARSRTDAPRGRPSTNEATDLPARAVPTAAQLHTLYLDDVFRYAARRLAKREDAEDVTAETFAAAFEALPSFRGDTDARLWLLGIARRKVADALRRQMRRREIAFSDELDETPDHSPSPSRALLSREKSLALHRVLANLKDEQREALLLKYVEDLSVEEIAVVMNRSKAAANSLLQRARATAFREGQEYFLDFLTPSESSPEATP